MIATVLVCPALGGRCCAAVEMGAQAKRMVVDSGCCDCQKQSVGETKLPPCDDNGSQHCHDCFCDGALPVGPNATDLLHSELSTAKSICVISGYSPASLALVSFNVHNEPLPLDVGQRLSQLCTLLI